MICSNRISLGAYYLSDKLPFQLFEQLWIIPTIIVSCYYKMGVLWRQPHRHSGLATLPSVGAVTPYYCRLGDLLCYTCMLYLSTILCVYAYVYFVFSLFSVLFSFVGFFITWGYRGGSPTAVQAWQTCPLWEPSPIHPVLL